MGKTQSNKVCFPGYFIAVPYACGQNQPSKPLKQLVYAASQAYLEVQAKKLFETYVSDDKKENKAAKLHTEEYFGDFRYGVDDVCLYLTHTEKEEKPQSQFDWVKTTKRRVPPLLKVVVGTYGTHYFLCCRQKWGWESCASGGLHPAPTMWCDIPANEAVTRLMRYRLAPFQGLKEL